MISLFLLLLLLFLLLVIIINFSNSYDAGSQSFPQTFGKTSVTCVASEALADIMRIFKHALKYLSIMK